jgi:pyruvate formate lyase activating enzyme
MLIGGLQKTTLIDYPGKIACTVFTIGCNFRCPFCYATELVLPEKIKNQPRISEKDFFEFLKGKQGLLEGVCICGGEPTIHQDLPQFCQKIKKLNYSVKLDTNGSNPEMLKKLIDEGLIDYVAMDIKSSKEKYEVYTGIKINLSQIENSINLLKQGGVGYEFRTTLAPGMERKDIVKIAEWIGPAKGYFLQEFNKQKEIIEPGILSLPLIGESEIKEAIEEISSNFEICQLR